MSFKYSPDSNRSSQIFIPENLLGRSHLAAIYGVEGGTVVGAALLAAQEECWGPLYGPFEGEGLVKALLLAVGIRCRLTTLGAVCCQAEVDAHAVHFGLVEGDGLHAPAVGAAAGAHMGMPS